MLKLQTQEKNGNRVMEHILHEVFPLHINEQCHGQGHVETNF